MKNKLSNDYLDVMHKNPANWKGIFYVNRKDPRIIVPKLYPSLGWTLNFGSSYSYVALIVLITLIIASEFIF